LLDLVLVHLYLPGYKAFDPDSMNIKGKGNENKNVLHIKRYSSCQ